MFNFYLVGFVAQLPLFVKCAVLVHIFCRLEVVNLVRDVARVCREWRGTLGYDAIFQRIFIRQFGANAAKFKQEMDMERFSWRTLVRFGGSENFLVPIPVFSFSNSSCFFLNVLGIGCS